MDLDNWLKGSWFCIWQFSDNRKINLNLEPKPAVVPERWQSYALETKKNKNPVLRTFFIIIEKK